MDEISFDAHFGDEIKKVRIYQMPFVLQSWYVLVDNKEITQIYERGSEYYYHGDELTVDDVQGIIDRITEFKGEPFHQAHFYKFSTHKEYWSKFKDLSK